MRVVKLLAAVVMGIMLSVAYFSAVRAEDDWSYYGGMALWAANIDAKIQAGSVTVDGKIDFGEILENLKGSLMGEMGAQKGRFSINGAYVLMALENDIPAVIGAAGDRTTSLNMFFAQALLGYDLFEIPIGKEMKLTVTPSAGPRYFYTRFVIDQLEGGELRDKSSQWVDFTVGLGANLDLNEKFSLLARGTAGGFGWGSSSEMAWSASGFVDYHIKDWSTLRVGYSYMDIDKKDTASFGDVQLDLQISGPVVEWIISF
jgi:hypothetical protein